MRRKSDLVERDDELSVIVLARRSSKSAPAVAAKLEEYWKGRGTHSLHVRLYEVTNLGRAREVLRASSSPIVYIIPDRYAAGMTPELIAQQIKAANLDSIVLVYLEQGLSGLPRHGAVSDAWIRAASQEPGSAFDGYTSDSYLEQATHMPEMSRGGVTSSPEFVRQVLAGEFWNSACPPALMNDEVGGLLFSRGSDLAKVGIDTAFARLRENPGVLRSFLKDGWDLELAVSSVASQHLKVKSVTGVAVPTVTAVHESGVAHVLSPKALDDVVLREGLAFKVVPMSHESESSTPSDDQYNDYNVRNRLSNHPLKRISSLVVRPFRQIGTYDVSSYGFVNVLLGEAVRGSSYSRVVHMLEWEYAEVLHGLQQEWSEGHMPTSRIEQGRKRLEGIVNLMWGLVSARYEASHLIMNGIETNAPDEFVPKQITGARYGAELDEKLLQKKNIVWFTDQWLKDLFSRYARSLDVSGKNIEQEAHQSLALRVGPYARAAGKMSEMVTPAIGDLDSGMENIAVLGVSGEYAVSRELRALVRGREHARGICRVSKAFDISRLYIGAAEFAYVMAVNDPSINLLRSWYDDSSTSLRPSVRLEERDGQLFPVAGTFSPLAAYNVMRKTLFEEGLAHEAFTRPLQPFPAAMLALVEYAFLAERIRNPRLLHACIRGFNDTASELKTLDPTLRDTLDCYVRLGETMLEIAEESYVE